MRSRSFELFGAVFVFAAGCGPAGPGSLEGFGDFGETEGPPPTVGDGDPGDGDPGDGDPGDGDGDGDCIDADYGNAPEIHFESFLEPDAPNDHEGLCEPSPGADYSIAWTAPVSGPYLAVMGSEFPGWLTVLRGGCNGTLEGCSGWDFPNSVYLDAVAGQDYTFVVDSAEPDFGGWFEFQLTPLNVNPDECPQGELSGVQDSVSGSTQGAGYGFGSVCGGEDAPDHAYLFVPPVDGVYHIDMFGSNYDTMLHVFQGECGGPLVECNDDSFDLQSELYVQLFAGQVYTIVADGFGSEFGNYQLNIELGQGNGELCSDVILLEGVPAVDEWILDDTSANVYNGCSFASFERRFVWYAPADGLYRVSQDAIPLFSGLAVLLGGCAGGESLCEVTGLDQEPSVEFPAFEGQEIVFVSEWEEGPPTVLSLVVEAVGGGGDPGCGVALDPGAPSFQNGNTLGSGNDYSGSCSSGPAPEDEYWWTAPATGSYRITTEGSAYDTLIHIRDGGCDGPEIACNDDTFQGQDVFLWSTIDVDLTAGQTISIFVDGYNGSGSYQLAITQL